MSDATSPPSASRTVSLMMPTRPTRPDYRGECLYKTGKCMNERALKTSGAAHNLCDEHRNRQNQHQRKLDAKNRLHKRERRVSTGASNNERFEPYPVVVKYQPLPTPVEKSEEAESVAATASPPSTASTPAAAFVATTVDDEKVITSNSKLQAPGLATTSTGVMFLTNGPQPPQPAFPFVMQDFDGIVVPLPSYLEGQERIEFRSRIYQKVLDFISEECILRFGDRAAIGAKILGAAGTKPTIEIATDRLQTEQLKCSDESAGESHANFKVSKVQQSSASASDESRTSSTTKIVH